MMCSNTYQLYSLIPGNFTLDRVLKQFVKSHPKEGEVTGFSHCSTYACEYIPIHTIHPIKTATNLHTCLITPCQCVAT